MIRHQDKHLTSIVDNQPQSLWDPFLRLLSKSLPPPLLNCACICRTSVAFHRIIYLTQTQMCLPFLWVVCFLLLPSVCFVSLNEGCSFDGVGHVVGHDNTWHIWSTFIKPLLRAVVSSVKYCVYLSIFLKRHACILSLTLTDHKKHL